jgi:hypothetical protein
MAIRMRLVFRDHVSGLDCWVRCISTLDRSSHANLHVEPNATSDSAREQFNARPRRRRVQRPAILQAKLSVLREDAAQAN